jgi:hypothetical protein
MKLDTAKEKKFKKIKKKFKKIKKKLKKFKKLNDAFVHKLWCCSTS